VVDDIVGEEDSERSSLDSSSFVFRGRRLIDVEPDELLDEMLRKARKP
jgi:hypothetical protein